MRVVVPPSTLNHVGRPSEDELDGLLRAFYQSELPNPWPAWQMPAARTNLPPLRAAKPRFLMSRTRWALAASVAFLAAGTLLLSSFFEHATTGTATTSEPAALDGGRADKKPSFSESLIQKGDGSVGGIRIDFHNRPNK